MPAICTQMIAIASTAASRQRFHVPLVAEPSNASSDSGGPYAPPGPSPDSQAANGSLAAEDAVSASAAASASPNALASAATTGSA